MMTSKHVVKVSEISSAWIARYELLNTQKSFFAPEKNGQLHFTSSLCMKNVQNGGASLDSLFKASWLHASKILDTLKLCNI